MAELSPSGLLKEPKFRSRLSNVNGCPTPAQIEARVNPISRFLVG